VAPFVYISLALFSKPAAGGAEAGPLLARAS